MINENTDFSVPSDVPENPQQHAQQQQDTPNTQTNTGNQQHQNFGNSVPPQPPYPPYEPQPQQYAPTYAARTSEKQLFGLYDPALQARVSTAKKVLYTIAGCLFGIIAVFVCFFISKDTAYEGQFKAEMFWVMAGVLLSYVLMIATWLLGLPISLFALLI